LLTHRQTNSGKNITSLAEVKIRDLACIYNATSAWKI